jgi:hypothetical protein
MRWDVISSSLGVAPRRRYFGGGDKYFESAFFSIDSNKSTIENLASFFTVYQKIFMQLRHLPSALYILCMLQGSGSF